MEEYIKESKQVINNFVVSFNNLKSDFNVSKTPKFHTIKDHILDYIELTGETLESLDQCTLFFTANDSWTNFYNHRYRYYNCFSDFSYRFFRFLKIKKT